MVTPTKAGNPSKHLLLTPSIYTLFLYTLINDEWKESDYVLSDRIPLVIHQRLRDLFGVEVYSALSPNKAWPQWKKIIFKDRQWLDYRRYAKGRQYKRVWGNDEFHLAMPYRNQGIEIIEDGPFNSMPKSFFIKRRLRQEIPMLPFSAKWLARNYISYGYDNRVKQIYHTSGIKLAPEIEHKGVCIDLNKMWREKAPEEQTHILNLFGIEACFLNNINSYTTVLVTQSLPIPDEDKIAIYKKMTKGMDETSLLIKTHYAETTDYHAHFPKAMIVSMPVPMQLFNLLGYSPKKIMTVSSSAIQPFVKEGVEVVFLGTECDERIKKVYGIVRLNDILGKGK